MNTKLLLLIFVIAGFSSCSTAYKAGQTPDDVYYSPVRPQNDYVRVENNEDKNVYNNNTDEDRNIRRNVHNRRWRRYDDYGYDYPYGVPYGNQYPPVYINPKTGVTTPVTKPQPRKFNLGAYKKPADNTTSNAGTLKGGNQVVPPNNTAPVRTFPKQSTNKGTGVGNFIRDLFSGSGQNNNNNNHSDNPSTRTFDGNNNSRNNNNNSNNSSGNSNSNSGKSNSSSAPVRTFTKDNN